MDPRLQEMLDHFEIRKVLAEYCNGCDRCDDERMGSVYLEDSWDDHGDMQLPGPEFARAMTQRILRQTDALSHLLGQSIIRIEGDEAGAETYFLAVAESTVDGRKMCNQLGGRFVDKLKREDGRWRIWRRVAVRDWAISLPVEQDWTAHIGLTDGRRSGDDPSFAALGRSHGGQYGGAA